MVRVAVVLTDKANAVIPGVGGPLQGVTGLSYTPDGCVVNGIGFVRFKIPLTVRRNTLIQPGMRVQVFEDNFRAAWAIVTAKSETITDDGIFAQFDCPDLFFLLQKLTVTSGYASAPGEMLATTLQRLLSLDTRETWTFFSDLFDPVTGVTAYDGIPYSIQGANIAQALTDFAGKRFSHVKRGIGMSIEFGAMNSKATFVAAVPDPVTTLAAPIVDGTQTAISVTSGSGFPAAGTFDIRIDAERMTVTGGQGTTRWTVQRGAAPVAHGTGTRVTGVDVGVTIARLTGITGPGAVPVAAQRQIDLPTLKHTKEGQVVNDIVPANGDSGISQLTLRTLYNYTGETPRVGPNGTPDGSYQSGPVAFTGFNPRYPICRRPAESDATFDGMDYFLQDTASIAANDLYMENMPPANIAPVKNVAGGVSPADLRLAAIALYQYGVSRLMWAAQSQETISCVTAGYADVRDFAGKRVHVYVRRQLPDGTDSIAIDLMPMVLRVEVAWDDTTGDPRYTWELSTNGKQAGSFANLVLGKLAQLDQRGYTLPTLPVPIYLPLTQNIGPDADLVIEMPPRNNVTGVHYMFGYLTLAGMVHTRNDIGHTQDVVTAPINHDVGSLPHDITVPSLDVTIPPVPIVGSPQLVVNDVTTGGGPTSTAVSAKLLNGSVSFYTNGANVGQAPLAGMPTTTAQKVATQATTIKSTTDGTGGTVKPTTGGTAGKTVQATHLVSGGFGARKAFATIEQVYRGPQPTGVTVWVDNVQRFGPFDTAPGVLDFTPWITDGNAHEFRVKAKTNGAATLVIQGVEDWTTLATR